LRFWQTEGSKARHKAAVPRLYEAIVAAARRPAFYRDGGVPDTLDGRFELLVLHVWLVLRRLKTEGAAELGQALFDEMFSDMDESLREIGVSDLGVGRRVKEMARALYGRMAAYDEGLAAPAAALEGALARNLYGTLSEPPAALPAMARFLREATAAIDGIPLDAILAGTIRFPEPRFD